MASLHCNSQVNRDSFFSNEGLHGNGRSCSKAQACLQKILHAISTIPPPSDEGNPNSLNNRGFEIDLNLRLGSVVDDGDGNEQRSESSAENSFVGKNPADGEDEEIQAKTATVGTDVSSDVTEIQKSGADGDEVKTGTAALNDAFDLLIEAAEMISGRDHCVNEKGKEVEEEGGFEDISPVVRSKRGRSQVLPHRFRDSVLEPWKKRPQSQSQSQRSTAMVSISRKKRRSW